MTLAGIDIGGTFTDLVAPVDGRLEVVKVPSTPDDPSRAFLDALGRLGASGVERVLHGTTVATNAVLERKGAKLAFVATEGFRHLLHLARQDRPSLYDLRARRPAPLAARESCVGARERLGPEGAVLRPLDDDAVREALAGLDAEAVAVCLLHAYANPSHERRVGEIVRGALPGAEVSLSSDVLPEIREYERASTTALNAYVQPVLARYLRRLEQTAGVPLKVMWSGGGTRGVRESSERPVHTLLSGPAAGALGGAWVARLLGHERCVTLDMGGTSTDVALVEDGAPLVAEESSLDGLPFRTPCIDVVSVGAGGGSVGWVDSGGALRVGPRSAGAVPGPAAYGRGGTEATVTDAHVVLGHLGPEGLAGGAVGLDGVAAAKAVGTLAAALGLEASDAAAGVLRVARATMARAVRSVSVERGKDVRGYVLVAFGGAGPLHGTSLASELGIGTILVPPVPGALAALGLLVAPPRADVSVSRPMDAADENDGELERVLAGLRSDAARGLAREGVDAADVSCAVDCRYRGQSHELRVPSPEKPSFARIREVFHAVHRERYGFSRPEAPVEAVTFRATALGPEPSVALGAPRASRSPEPTGSREISGSRVPVYARDELPAGWRERGPALVSELDATVWVGEGWGAEVDESGTLVMRA